MKILLVEDARAMNERIYRMVNVIPHALLVEEAESAEDAICQLEQYRSDVVVLELRLRRGSGLSVLEHIKAAHPEAIAILLTNYEQSDYLAKCMKVGPTYYFDKSLSDPALPLIRQPGLAGKSIFLFSAPGSDRSNDGTMASRSAALCAASPAKPTPRRKTMIKPIAAALTAALSVYSSLSCAADLGDWVKLDGFGTIGAYRSDDTVAATRADTKVKATSRNNTIFDADSQVSVQGTVNPSGRLKGVVQLLAKQDIKGSTTPKVEWAYLGFDATSSLNLKLGRVVAPIFLMSDYRNLNYAQTMVRPPQTYFVNPISFLEGASATWSHSIGDGELKIDGYGGKSSVNVSLGKVNVDNTWGGSVKWSQNAWAVRAHHSEYRMDLVSPTFTAAVNQFTTPPFSLLCTNCASVILDRFKLTGIKAKINTLAASYDDGIYAGQVEYGKRTSDSIPVTNDVTTWYAMGSRRFGQFTPYISYMHWKATNDPYLLTTAAGAPTMVTSTVNYLNASNMSVGNNDRNSLSMGVRWDFYKNLALKAQWEQYKLKHPEVGSTGAAEYPTSLLGAPSGFDGKINAYTINLDFVF